MFKNSPPISCPDHFRSSDERVGVAARSSSSRMAWLFSLLFFYTNCSTIRLSVYPSVHPFVCPVGRSLARPGSFPMGLDVRRGTMSPGFLDHFSLITQSTEFASLFSNQLGELFKQNDSCHSFTRIRVHWLRSAGYQETRVGVAHC